MTQSAQIIHGQIRNISASPALSPLKGLNNLKTRVMKAINFMSESMLFALFFYRLGNLSSAFRFNRGNREIIT